MSGDSQDPFRSAERDPQPGEDARMAAAEAGDQPRQNPGDLLPRVGARVIDLLIVSAASLVLVLGLDVSNQWLAPQVVLYYAYFVLLDAYVGTTVGKRFLHLRVTGPRGDKPTLKQAAIREAFILLDMIRIPWVGSPLSLIAWVVIIVTIQKSPTKQGMHDRIAGGTHVIEA